MSEKVDPFDLSAGAPPVVAAGIEGEKRPKPKASIGMSKRVIGGLVGIAVVMLVVFMVALDGMDQKNEPAQAQKEETAAPKGVGLGQVPSEMKSDRKGAVVPPAEIPPPEVPATNGKAPGSAPGSVPGNTSVLGGQGVAGQGMVPAQAQGAGAPLTPEQQRVMKLKEERENRLQRAKSDGLESKSYQEGGVRAPAVANGGPSGGPGGGQSGGGEMPAGIFGSQGGGQSAVSNAAPGSSQSDQDQKLRFIQQGGTAQSGYHTSTVMPPLSPFQLNAGSFIPAVLEMAVNSDLPGPVTARVRENVYDSVTGRCLLIPSATKLLGSYDSKVAIGQARQLVVWNRATLPNGGELNMAGMPSADQSGQSGFEADVDNHWLRLFGVALGMTAVTAGVQLSVPAAPVATGNTAAPPTNAQVVATALAQQFGQLGGQMMGKYLNVQPTLRNYPGERFNIIVPKNIIFPGCYRG